jgi:hypothetical protein
MRGAIITLIWYGIVGVPTVAAVGPVYYAETIVPLVIPTASGLARVIALARARLASTRLTHALIVTPLATTLASLRFRAVSRGIARSHSQRHAGALRAGGVTRARQGGRVRPQPLRAVRGPGLVGLLPPSEQFARSQRSRSVRSGQRPEKDRELLRYLPDRTPYPMQTRDRKLILVPLSR